VTCPSDYDTQLAHLVKLAQTPGWKEYAWNRAKELDACQSNMWLGIAKDLREAMLARVHSQPKSAAPTTRA